MTEQEMQQSQPVRTLQHMLNELSGAYSFLPELDEDGLFGEDTLEAVMIFQRELHPPVTGIVDRETWNAILKKWQDLRRGYSMERPARMFPQSGFQVEPGGEHELMMVPQAMFRALNNYFSGVSAAAPNGLHGVASAANVRWLQRAAGMAETGIMDQAVWNMLARLYEVFVVGAPAAARRNTTGGWG